MTAIAYKDGIIAADTNAYSDDLVVGRAHKIRKQNSHIGGAAGTALACERFFTEFSNGNALNLHIKGRRVKDLEAIVIDGEKTLWFVGVEGSHIVNAPFFALGAAKEFLTGAMAAGASAEEAVRLAVRHHALCGGEVETYSID